MKKLNKKVKPGRPPKPSDELQKAIDAFPKVVRLKEKAAREKNRIRKNFLSVKAIVYK
jgi:hypothetical protein